MKIRMNRRYAILGIMLLVLLTLTGCARIQGPDGQILPEKIITLTTPFKYMIDNEGWFEALFVWPVAQVINYFSSYMGAGFSIIVITLLSRVLTIGMTVKSTVQTQKMQMLQPEINRINEKYAGKTDEQSKLKMSQETMALYQKHKLNPFGAIAGTFIQLPIFLAMWQATQRAEAVINGTFLGLDMRAMPMDEITKNFMEGGYIYLILIVLMALAQYASMKLPTYLAKKQMKDRDKKAPGQNQMNMMTNVMFVMIVGMAFTMPTAMTFYWLVSATVGAAQTVFIQKRYVDNAKV